MTEDRDAERQLTKAGLKRLEAGMRKVEDGSADMRTGARMVEFANHKPDGDAKPGDHDPTEDPSV